MKKIFTYHDHKVVNVLTLAIKQSANGEEERKKLIKFLKNSNGININVPIMFRLLAQQKRRRRLQTFVEGIRRQ